MTFFEIPLHGELRESILIESEYLTTLKMFKTHFESFILVSISPMLSSTIERLVRGYPPREFDAIHLSSALMIKDAGNLPLQFACFDHALNEAALNEGLTLV